MVSSLCHTHDLIPSLTGDPLWHSAARALTMEHALSAVPADRSRVKHGMTVGRGRGARLAALATPVSR